MNKQVQNYVLQESVGKGVYGKVYRALHMKSNLQYAVKVIPKSIFQANPKLEQLAINEIKILSSFKNDNIVKFVQTLKTSNNFYFVYEYCNGGNLEELISKRKFLPEAQALKIFKELIEAFKQLNKNSVMHRDLKPDNIFFANGKVKLGDFGFCKMLEVNMAQTMLGSPIYMAPQILKEEIYTSKADIWSLGVVLFQMLYGFCPFESSSISELINVLKKAQLQIPDDSVNTVSQQTKQLLQKMLIKDQFKRIEWVDLFEYRIDENGTLIPPTKKDYSIETLENYFLFNNASVQPTVYSQFQIRPSESPTKKPTNKLARQYVQQPIVNTQPSTNMNTPSSPTFQFSHKRENPPSYSLKQIKVQSPITGNINFNKNNAVNHFPELTGPPKIQQWRLNQQTTNSSGNQRNTQFEESKIVRDKVNRQEKQSIGQQVSSPIIKSFGSSPTLNDMHSFERKHEAWLKGLEIICKLSNNNKQGEQALIYWMLINMHHQLITQVTISPQWTEMILEEKNAVAELVVKLEPHEKYKYQNILQNPKQDGKNELLKLWKKCKRDQIWEQAIKYMFGTTNPDYSAQQLLLI